VNKAKLQKEGKKWVKDGIITDIQLDSILSTYKSRDPFYIFITFAVLFISIGVILFVFTDWTNILAITRVIIITIFMLILYLLGIYFHKNENKTYGISFIILGYIFFGATLILIINVYNVTFFAVWMFFIWGTVGLLLYFIYRNVYLLSVGLLITIIGQLYSGIDTSNFHIWLFGLFILGYFHFIFHNRHRLTSYLFVIGFQLQMLVLMFSENLEYYWLIVLFFLPYVLSRFIKEDSFKQALTYISILSIFIFKIFESFLLQESYFLEETEYHVLFFIIWGIVWISLIGWDWLNNEKIELMNLILFVPLFFLPYSYIAVLLTMFTFAIYWLIVGYQQQTQSYVVIGMTSFIISTFTTYIQFAWEMMNRSLFFIIGGILLFVISSFFERKRRTMEGSKG